MDREILNLLQKTGISATLRKRVSGSYDVNTSSVTQTTTDYTVQCHLVSYSDKVIGNLVTKKDRKALIAGYGMTVVPSDGDYLISGGVTYSIVDVQKIVNGTEVVAYICQVRV